MLFRFTEIYLNCCGTYMKAPGKDLLHAVNDLTGTGSCPSTTGGYLTVPGNGFIRTGCDLSATG